MSKTKFTLSVLATFVFVIACTTAAQAQAQRTFVAGPGIGLDTNNTVGQGYCSFTNPCRNFSVAFAVTNTGGEIIAISPGVGYGGLSINRSITVTGLPGQVAFVAVGASTTGFSVAPGATDQVVIRNISFNGSGTASSTGLAHSSGKLIIDGCNFTQLATGVRGTGGTVVIKNSSFTSNGTRGLHVSTGSKAQVLDSLFANNGTGLTADGACASVFIRIDGGSVVNNTLGFEMLNAGAGCPPQSGSLNPNIFARINSNTASALTTNISSNTTAVGPSPGAGQQAVVGTYTSDYFTSYP